MSTNPVTPNGWGRIISALETLAFVVAAILQILHGIAPAAVPEVAALSSFGVGAAAHGAIHQVP